MYWVGTQWDDRHRLAMGASPEAIHDALPPHAREEFLAAYRRELDAANHTLDLTAVFETLELWRAEALRHAQPEAFRHIPRLGRFDDE